ncbi:MBL fold metallo-hydrolase [Priestia sp. OVL9]|nr:MBL fold metallo-hydrolase [Priestia sp. OVL9]
MGVPPIKGVAITHWHWDHTFGIHAMNKYTISHHLTKKKLAYLKTLRWDDDSLDKRVQEGRKLNFAGYDQERNAESRGVNFTGARRNVSSSYES